MAKFRKNIDSDQLYLDSWTELIELSGLSTHREYGLLLITFCYFMFCLHVPIFDAQLKGMEDEICPYATFHLLGFREEMDPTKAMNFQTFPHQNGTATPGHTGTMGTGPSNAHLHSRSGSQSMVWSNLIVFN